MNQAFCERVDERRLVLRVNQQEIPLNSDFYVDLLHIAQPSSGDLPAGGAKIWVGVDADADTRNGVLAEGTVLDTTPVASNSVVPGGVFVLGEIAVRAVTASQNVIRRVHSLSI